MREGKLSNQDLERLVLSKFHSQRPEVLVPPGVGLDCAMLDMGDFLCVLSTDPITAADTQIGALAVHVCCNDAASSGAEPVGLLTTLLLPPDTTDEQIAQISQDVADAAKQAQVDILGGHTEFTSAVNRPLISATVLAKAQKGQLINSAQMQPGDALYMSKWAGLEGTLVLVSDREEWAKQILSPKEKEEVLRWKEELSIVREAIAAREEGAIAMHDATEGGVLGAAWEMAEASGCGLLLSSSSIPLREETIKIAQAYQIDPLRLIASGSLLIALPESAGEKLQIRLAKEGIVLSKIGMATQKDEAVLLDGEVLSAPETDELYAAQEWD